MKKLIPLIIILGFIGCAHPSTYQHQTKEQSEVVKIYDDNLRLKYYIENGKIYDDNWRYKGNIE